MSTKAHERQEVPEAPPSRPPRFAPPLLLSALGVLIFFYGAYPGYAVIAFHLLVVGALLAVVREIRLPRSLLVPAVFWLAAILANVVLHRPLDRSVLAVVYVDSLALWLVAWQAPVSSRRGWVVATIALLLVSALSSLFQKSPLFEWLFGFRLPAQRALGTFDHPNMAAAAYGTGFLLALERWAASRRKLWVVPLLVFLSALLLTGSFLALFALAVAVGAFLSRREKRRQVLFPAVLFGAGALLLLALASVEIEKGGVVFSKRGSLVGRLHFWQTAGLMFKAEPLWGHGIGRFQDISSRYQRDVFYARHPHGVVFSLLSGGGVVLLFGWLFMMAAVALTLAPSSGLIYPLLFLALHSLGDFHWEHPPSLALFFTLAGLAGSSRLSSPRAQGLGAALGLVLLAATLPAFAWGLVREAEINLREGARMSLEKKRVLMERLAPFHGGAAAVRGAICIVREDYACAQQAFKRSLDLVPERADVWYQLSLAYAADRRLEEARRALKQATALAPFEPHFHQALATVERAAGNKQSAQEAGARAEALRARKRAFGLP